MNTFTESDHREFNMEDFKKRQRAAKIQAAIDALPNATGGEWRQEPWTVVDDETGSSVLTGPVGIHRDRKIIVDVNERLPEHAANATLIAASKDLAEEVVRLRGSNNRLRGSNNRLREVIAKFWESAQRATPATAPDEPWRREYELVHPSEVGVDMPGPGCRDHGVRTVAHKEGDVLVVDSVEVIPNPTGPDVSCDVCGETGFPRGANCPRCGRPENLLRAASEGEA